MWCVRQASFIPLQSTHEVPENVLGINRALLGAVPMACAVGVPQPSLNAVGGPGGEEADKAFWKDCPLSWVSQLKRGGAGTRKGNFGRRCTRRPEMALALSGKLVKMPIESIRQVT